jgi:hypothetical protein
LRRVLNKIHRDRDRCRLRFAYANPAYRSVFAQHSWLEQYDLWNDQRRHLEHPIAFYRSRD